MKKRNMKMRKVMTVALASAMVLGMSTSAFAAEGNGGKINTPTSEAGATITIPVSKTLYFVNNGADRVFEPNITYTYKISGVSEEALNGATVTDASGKTATVKAGDMRAITDPTVELYFRSTHEAVAITDGKGAVIKQNSFTFDASKLTTEGQVVPGIYRYKIEEETSQDTKNAAGVVEGEKSKVLYLDVFVGLDESGDPAVQGSTIHDPGYTDPSQPVDNNDDGDKDPETTPGTNEDETGKTTGFGDGDDSNLKDDRIDGNDDGDIDDGDEDPLDKNEDGTPTGQKTGQPTVAADKNLATVDTFTTYNVTVTKNVTGTMGDKSNYFPFEAVIANTIENSRFDVIGNDQNKTKTIAANTTYGSASATAVDQFKLKSGEKFSLKGIASKVENNVPGGLTVAANEFNNTGDTYKVTVKNGEATVLNGVDLAKSTKSEAAAQELVKDSTTDITFTNNLDAVSPTGVALRFAPYIAIIGAALALLGFTRRRRA